MPEEFPGYEAAAEFWDTHDTTDYPERFRTVKVVSKLRNRHYEIPLAPDVVRALEKQARESGVTLGRLTSNLLRHLLRQRLSR
ncbi:MAG TPA: CopG family antitoxin [Terriglobia bacterium]|nr:CopG family antitoxin [Terriglobia bacterium]